jgi:hypothetical protein
MNYIIFLYRLIFFVFFILAESQLVINTAAGINFFRSIVMSSDGTKLAAVVNDDTTRGNIYISKDSGESWTEKIVGDGPKKWKSIAISSDGSKLAAVIYGGYIYLSTDSGVSWSEMIVGGGPKKWQSIAMSSDGTKLNATEKFVWLSTDFGNSWIIDTAENGKNNSWGKIESSYNGFKETNSNTINLGSPSSSIPFSSIPTSSKLEIDDNYITGISIYILVYKYIYIYKL